ncbi:glycosyltransferase family 2 protein [Arthrobacter rhombi]|uniref:glycosyltransferase family 2 protein n=1 Tax=Arthrobacter rhombi TaxID=71253 RepID=UPI003FD450D9
MTFSDQIPAVSYVMPVLNEAEYVGDAVEGILGQDFDGPKEIILALGPSDDGTNAVVEQMALQDSRIRWVQNPSGRTPAGLNLAIKASMAPIVIRVDAHSVLDPQYTRRGVATLVRSGAADVGGQMDAQGRNSLQRAVAAAYNSPLGLGGAAYHSGAPEGPAESAYLGIFRRSIFDEVGFYDESLWRGQDWELCLRIRQAGEDVWFDPSLKTTYFPRDNYRRLAAQSYAAGVWRGELARRYPEGKTLRHFAPPVMAVSVALGTVAWLVDADNHQGMGRFFRRTLRSAPVAYLALAVAASAQASTCTVQERLHLLRVLPTIHFPWACGFVRGRLLGAGQTTDQSRQGNPVKSSLEDAE